MKQNTVETGLVNAGGARWIPPTATFASPPSSPTTGTVYLFTDALTAGAVVGGGTALSTCRWSGSAWVATGGSGSGGGGASGALILLEQHTASNSASLDFTACITSTYDEYMIEIINLLPVTNATNLRMLLSTNGGSSYDSGSNYSNACMRWLSSATGNGGGTTYVSLDGDSALGEISNDSTHGGLVGTFRFYSPLSTSIHKRLVGQVGVWYTGSAYLGVVIASGYLSTTAVNAFQVLAASGNLASGTVRVYGVAKTTVASPDFILVNGA